MSKHSRKNGGTAWRPLVAPTAPRTAEAPSAAGGGCSGRRTSCREGAVKTRKCKNSTAAWLFNSVTRWWIKQWEYLLLMYWGKLPYPRNEANERAKTKKTGSHHSRWNWQQMLAPDSSNWCDSIWKRQPGHWNMWPNFKEIAWSLTQIQLWPAFLHSEHL